MSDLLADLLKNPRLVGNPTPAPPPPIDPQFYNQLAAASRSRPVRPAVMRPQPLWGQDAITIGDHND